MLYYVYVEGRAVGPLPIENLRPYVESGAMNGDTLAWTEALERWQSARTIAALVEAFPVLAKSAPPPARAEAPPPSAGPLAGFGERFAAGAIDFAALGLPLTIFMIVVGPAAPGEARSLLVPGFDASDWIFMLASAAYFIGFMGPLGRGATPGYRLMRLRLVKRGALTPPAWGASFLWALVNSINAVGFLWYFFDVERRMLHNLVSDTIVLKVK